MTSSPFAFYVTSLLLVLSICLLETFFYTSLNLLFRFLSFPPLLNVVFFLSPFSFCFSCVYVFIVVIKYSKRRPFLFLVFSRQFYFDGNRNSNLRLSNFQMVSLGFYIELRTFVPFSNWVPNIPI